jgi:hypothetical protein
VKSAWGSGESVAFSPGRSSGKGLLYGLLAASLFLHLGALILFPVRDQGSLPSLEAPDLPRVFFVCDRVRDVPVNRELIFWLKLRDPASLVRPREDHRGEEGLSPNSLKQLPFSLPADRLQKLSRNPSGPLNEGPDLTQMAKDALVLPTEEFHYASPFSVISLPEKTIVEWEGPVGAESGLGWTLPQAHAELLSETAPTVLRLAVGPEGRVEHVLIEESSGRWQTDRLAWQKAYELRFPYRPGKPELLWMRAYILWRFTSPKDTAPSSPPR